MAHVFNNCLEDTVLDPEHHTCFACGIQAECSAYGGKFFCIEQCYDAAVGDEPAYSDDDDSLSYSSEFLDELP